MSTTIKRLALTKENQYSDAVLTIPILQIGRLSHGELLNNFALLRNAGCTIEWADQIHKSLLDVTYYNVRLEGAAIYLDIFMQWIEQLAA